MTESPAQPRPAQVASFQQTYEAHAPWVFGVLRRLGASEASCEDLVHDVFVAAWKAWNRIDLSRPLKPWLFGVAYRVMLDHHRRRSTWSETATASPPERASDEAAGPSEALSRRQGLTLAARIIAGLEVERRAVFVMHELEEMPMPEIARALEVPLNTAYSRLRLARRDFEQAAAALGARHES